MHVEDDEGLRIALLDVNEALSGEWHAAVDEIDVVRVHEPPHASWDALMGRGFTLKPGWVTWIAAPEESNEAYLRRLSKKDRYDLRRSGSRLVSEGIEVTVTTPLEEDALDEFLALYQKNIATLRRGIPVAVANRGAMLEHAVEHILLLAREGGRPVAGCIGLDFPDEDSFRVRFSASDPSRRSLNLTRALYVRMIDIAREHGRSMVLLGSEPNLYGHICGTGLYSFKSRMGFRAVSSQVVPGMGTDEADLVVSLRHLDEPSLALAYSRARRDTDDVDIPLDVVVYAANSSVDPEAFHFSFVNAARSRRVEEATGY